jgi:hypothetical protein
MNESKELTVLNNQEVAPATDFASMSGIDGITLKPTNLNIVQNTTRNPMQARAGQLLDTLSGTGYDTMEVVPLKILKGRVLFPPSADLDAEPICRSNDGLVPAPNVKTPQASNCKTCQYSQWRNDQKPPCAEKMGLLLIDRATMLPYRLQVTGKSISILKQAVEQIVRDIYLNKMKNKVELNLHDYYFTISTEKVTSKKGVFFVLNVQNVRRVAEPGEFGPLFEQFVAAASAFQHDEDAVQQAQAIDNRVNDAVSQVLDAEPVEI